MYLSVSVIASDKGYVPRLVFENPRIITVFDVGEPCPTWKEAYIVARAMARDRKYILEQVQVNA